MRSTATSMRLCAASYEIHRLWRQLPSLKPWLPCQLLRQLLLSLSLCFGCGDGDRVFPGSSIISPRRAECYTCMDLSGSHPGKLHKLWTRLAAFRASAVDGAAATVNPDGLSCPGVVRIDGCQGGAWGPEPNELQSQDAVRP